MKKKIKKVDADLIKSKKDIIFETKQNMISIDDIAKYMSQLEMMQEDISEYINANMSTKAMAQLSLVLNIVIIFILLLKQLNYI